MTLRLQGQPVIRIVVHGSEQTIWEPPISGDGCGATLKIATPQEVLGITDHVNVRFDKTHNIEPESLAMTEHVCAGLVPIGSTEVRAGMNDSVQIFINDEEIV
jgi:hypothetical protein